MQCPVCSRAARNLTPNTLIAVVLGCGTCGDYRIAGDSYASFARLEGTCARPGPCPCQTCLKIRAADDRRREPDCVIANGMPPALVTVAFPALG